MQFIGGGDIAINAGALFRPGELAKVVLITRFLVTTRDGDTAA